jgi:hypothetical protein
MIGVLQHARQAGAATQGGFVLGGVLWTPSFGFRGENLRSDLHWFTWQWRIYICLLVEGIVWSLFELSLG